MRSDIDVLVIDYVAPTASALMSLLVQGAPVVLGANNHFDYLLSLLPWWCVIFIALRAEF